MVGNRSAIAVNQNRLLNCLSHTCGKELQGFYRLFSITLWILHLQNPSKIPRFLDHAATFFCWSFGRKMHRIPWPQVFVPLALFSLDTQRARKAQTKHRQRVGRLAFGQICWYPARHNSFWKVFPHLIRHLQWDSNYWSLFKCCCVTMWCYFFEYKHSCRVYADPLRWMTSIPSLWHEATFRNYAHSVATQKELISSIASWQNVWHFITQKDVLLCHPVIQPWLAGKISCSLPWSSQEGMEGYDTVDGWNLARVDR